MKQLIKTTKNKLRQVRHRRVRARVSGTAQLPRLSVFRSLTAVRLQLIDDVTGRTICAINTDKIAADKLSGTGGKKTQAAFAAGKMLAELALAKGIKQAVFDRGGYSYHGRVAAVAEGARAAGLVV